MGPSSRSLIFRKTRSMRRTQRVAAAISESATVFSLVVVYFTYVFQIWNGPFFNSSLGDRSFMPVVLHSRRV
jgi:hypothetical protein